MKFTQIVKYRFSNTQRGFSFFEAFIIVIVVLLIVIFALGKYFELRERAQLKTLQYALSEGNRRINEHFANAVISGNTPGSIFYSDTSLGTQDNEHNFTLSYTTSGNNIIITVRGITKYIRGLTRSKIIPKPGSE